MSYASLVYFRLDFFAEFYVVCKLLQLNRSFLAENTQYWEKKEEIWLSPVTKIPTPTEQSKKATWQHKTPPKTLITQLLQNHIGIPISSRFIKTISFYIRNDYMLWCISLPIKYLMRVQLNTQMCKFKKYSNSHSLLQETCCIVLVHYVAPKNKYDK